MVKNTEIRQGSIFFDFDIPQITQQFTVMCCLTRSGTPFISIVVSSKVGLCGFHYSTSLCLIFQRQHLLRKVQSQHFNISMHWSTTLSWVELLRKPKYEALPCAKILWCPMWLHVNIQFNNIHTPHTTWAHQHFSDTGVQNIFLISSSSRSDSELCQYFQITELISQGDLEFKPRQPSIFN